MKTDKMYLVRGRIKWVQEGGIRTPRKCVYEYRPPGTCPGVPWLSLGSQEIKNNGFCGSGCLGGLQGPVPGLPYNGPMPFLLDPHFAECFFALMDPARGLQRSTQVIPRPVA